MPSLANCTLIPVEAKTLAAPMTRSAEIRTAKKGQERHSTRGRDHAASQDPAHRFCTLPRAVPPPRARAYDPRTRSHARSDVALVCADFSGPKQFPGPLTFCTEYNNAPDNGNTCCSPADEECAARRPQDPARASSHARSQLSAQYRVEHWNQHSAVGMASDLFCFIPSSKTNRVQLRRHLPLTVSC